MQCIRPFKILVKQEGKFTEKLVACGACVFCKRQKSLEWSVRLKHELQKYGKDSAFITLTYNDINLPYIVENDKKVEPVLRQRDMQLFMKRLRKFYSNYSNTKLKYFYCGEYGSKTNRPHYHIILFGMTYQSLQPYILRNKMGKNIYSSILLNNLWQLGENQIGIVTEKSIGYVCGYIVDKLLDKRPHTVKPYNRSSQGMGIEFAMKYKEKLQEDQCIKVDGKKVPIPRYYVRKLGLEIQPVTVKKILEVYKKQKEYKESNQISWSDIIDLAKQDAEQREATYIARKKKDKEI